MKKFRGVMVFATALALTLSIVLLQLAWNLGSPKYLQGVAEQAGTNQAVAAALPDYAASKLPDPQAARAAFSQHVSAGSIRQTLDSLYSSITQAYVGKTDVVEIDIAPLTVPIKANGYEIPPGTVFANDTLQVGGLAGVLRLAQKSLLPSLLVCLGLLVITLLIGIKRGIVPSLRSVLLVSCLLLAGLFLASLVLPALVSSLVVSSGLDAALRDIVLPYIGLLIADAGRYYLAWMVLFGVVIVVVSIWTGVMHRARRPSKASRRQQAAPVEPKPKEL